MESGVNIASCGLCFFARGAEAGAGGACLLARAFLDARHHGSIQSYLAAGVAAGIAEATISSSTSDWPAELDGGPGGSVDAGPLPLLRDGGHLDGTELDTEALSSAWAFFPQHRLDAFPVQSLTKGALQLVSHALVDAHLQIVVGAVSREGNDGLSSREFL